MGKEGERVDPAKGWRLGSYCKMERVRAKPWSEEQRTKLKPRVRRRQRQKMEGK